MADHKLHPHQTTTASLDASGLHNKRDHIDSVGELGLAALRHAALPVAPKPGRPPKKVPPPKKPRHHKAPYVKHPRKHKPPKAKHPRIHKTSGGGIGHKAKHPRVPTPRKTGHGTAALAAKLTATTGGKIDGQTHDAFMTAYNSGLEWAVNYVAIHPEVIPGAGNGTALPIADAAASAKHAASKIHHLKGSSTGRHAKSTGTTTAHPRATHSGPPVGLGPSGTSTGSHATKGASQAAIVGRNSTQFHPTHPIVPSTIATRLPH